MKRKILHFEHNNRTNIFQKTRLFWSILAAVAGIGFLSGGMGAAAKAAEQSKKAEVGYEYDQLGRVSKVTYPDGKLIIYIYDANGNLQEVQKTTTELEEKPAEGTEKPTTGETGSKPEGEAGKPTTGGTGGKPQEGTGTSAQLPPVYDGHSPFSLENMQSLTVDLRYTAEDVKNYNKFKKKLPKIKSLKCKDGNKKDTLSIRIQQVNARGKYGETGYEIRYSENAKFKSSKKVTVSRRKKGKDTSKSWDVKKGKTYYVKVRAYMKTVTGKKIYTKYSKVKKIKTVK